MRALPCCTLVLVGLLGLVGVASAQSFNIAFGNGTAPSSDYSAAGEAGTWNRILGACNPDNDDCTTYPLVDLDGSATSVTMEQGVITGVLAGTDTSVSGDDSLLLNNGIFDNTEFGNNICTHFAGLTPGNYQMIMYAWTPSQPTVKTLTIQDNPAVMSEVGGAWPGHHEEGITFATYIVPVASGETIISHAGLVQ